MERLTFRTESGWVGINKLDSNHTSPTSVAIHKLAEFEDFMEEFGFKNLFLLERYIKISNKNSEILMKKRLELALFKSKWLKLQEYIQQLESESDNISEDLYYIKEKMQELEKE